MTAVKFVDEANWIIEGLILPFGGGLPDGNDLTGSHFTKSTDFCEEWFPDGGRPGLYAHGFDADLKTSVVGREIGSWKDDKGRWLRAQIDKAHEYAAEIKELIDNGLLHLSSGAVDHLVAIKAKTGEIERWPFVEWSLVPNPANPEAVAYNVKSTDAIAHLAVVETAVPDAMKAEAVVVGEAGPELFTPAAAGTIVPNDAIKEGRRHSTADFTSIQSIHDAACSLGADCSGAGKAAVIPPAPLLAIKAGDEAAPEPVVDLEAVKQLVTAAAVAHAKELVGR